MTTPRDFLGQELAVGDLVIYPVLSGRSCQMALAEILSMEVVSDLDEFNERTRIANEKIPNHVKDGVDQYGYTKWRVDGFKTRTKDEVDEMLEGKRAGTVTKAKVQPVGVTSRWRQHGWSVDSVVRPVTLHANAKSMVRAPESVQT